MGISPSMTLRIIAQAEKLSGVDASMPPGQVLLEEPQHRLEERFAGVVVAADESRTDEFV
jgi:hypothetical protein